MTDQLLQLPLKVEVKFPLADGRMLVQGPLTYNTDGLATRHNCDFMRDPGFVEAYRYGMLDGRPDLHIEWRVHIALWVAQQAAQLDGDFVECGVNTGILSGAILIALDFHAKWPQRKFFLLDTFAGIPEEQISAAERAVGVSEMNRKYQDGDQLYAAMQKKFARWPNAVIVRGRVPETLSAITSQKISYASIDMNVVEPEIAAGEFLWPRLVPGGLILLDDYGWAPHVNQKYAWDVFAKGKGVSILSLPTGQALIMKPH
ncbi:TylF/MycF/NovP-related O-methyltransferase [Dongia sp.]|uniref:TylF/MycF/NovP-related O-methyltransferase n=1 Tax=Dongia sp. TaxID=1977262 RepID=UPI0035AE192F